MAGDMNPTFCGFAELLHLQSLQSRTAKLALMRTIISDCALDLFPKSVGLNHAVEYLNRLAEVARVPGIQKFCVPLLIKQNWCTYNEEDRETTFLIDGTVVDPSVQFGMRFKNDPFKNDTFITFLKNTKDVKVRTTWAIVFFIPVQ